MDSLPLGAAVSRRQFVLGSMTLALVSGCAPSPGTLAVNTGQGVEVFGGTVSVVSVTDVSAVSDNADSVPETDSATTTVDGLTNQFEVTHTDGEWRGLLTPEQYDVLRNAGTESPYSSPLNDEHHAGLFSCAGCSLDLFSSTTKFDSGTGWPSFWQALPDSVLENVDTNFGMSRTEVVCRRCGGHLGHVFGDGPEPTGLRYCMNGVALNFSSD